MLKYTVFIYKNILSGQNVLGLFWENSDVQNTHGYWLIELLVQNVILNPLRLHGPLFG